MTPDGHVAERYEWKYILVITKLKDVLDYILYFIFICFISFTQIWSFLDVTNILSLLGRMCQTFKIDLFIITQALGHHVQLQESFKLW